MYNRKVPLSRIINMDQTPIRVVFPAKKTISPKGVKQVIKFYTVIFTLKYLAFTNVKIL